MALIDVSPPNWKSFSVLKANEESRVSSMSSVWFLPWRRSLTHPVITCHCYTSQDVNSLNCLRLKRLKLQWCGWLRTCTTRSMFSAPDKNTATTSAGFYLLTYFLCSLLHKSIHLNDRKVNLFDLAVFKKAQQQPEKQHLKPYFSTPAQSGGFSPQSLLSLSGGISPDMPILLLPIFSVKMFLKPPILCK